PSGASGPADSAATANTPVSNVPVAPPMPWTPNTSSESSYPIRSFSQVQAQKQIAPAISPMTTPCQGSTKPDAGVMAPRPAMAPVQRQSPGVFRRSHNPGNTRGGARVGPERGGAVLERGARAWPRGAGPPLKPSQPTQSRPMPITASDRSWGAKLSLP